MQKDIILVCQTLLENRKNHKFITLADSKGIAYFSKLLYASLCWEWAEGGGVGGGGRSGKGIFFTRISHFEFIKHNSTYDFFDPANAIHAN